MKFLYVIGGVVRLVAPDTRESMPGASIVGWMGPEDVRVGWSYDGLNVIAPPPPPSPPPPSFKITKLAFRNRFLRTEKIGLELAALDDPTAPMQLRQRAAAIRADLADQRDATYIDLSRDDTRAGVMALEALGLIGPGRAAEILDSPIQDIERYKE